MKNLFVLLFLFGLAIACGGGGGSSSSSNTESDSNDPTNPSLLSVKVGHFEAYEAIPEGDPFVNYNSRRRTVFIATLEDSSVSLKSGETVQLSGLNGIQDAIINLVGPLDSGEGGWVAVTVNENTVTGQTEMAVFNGSDNVTFTNGQYFDNPAPGNFYSADRNEWPDIVPEDQFEVDYIYD